ncbi:MAG: DUF3347 domain-containing protein [Flavobacteriaceae bacterium]|nr:DUF3347 domain-containing protein [Flavobacteriaceae bacterium]
MKNLKTSIAAMLLLVSLTNAQEKEKMNHDHSKMNMDGIGKDNMQMAPEFNSQQLAVSYEHYIMIKTALVNSDSNEAKKGATMLTASLKEAKGTESASKAAKNLENAEDLKSQRIAFSELSDAMAILAEGNLKSGMIYKDFCPMALGGGAYWLSSDKEIQNPYFGDKMLKCGTTKSIIK